MIIKYWGKIRLHFPNNKLWPFTDPWIEEQYVKHMNLERTYYFYDHFPVDPLCLQYYGRKHPIYGFAPWILHPGINRGIAIALRNNDAWMRCVIASEVDLKNENVPNWIQVGNEISRNTDLDLSTKYGNWHNIKDYITEETSRDQIPGNGHWIVEAHDYTRKALGDKKIVFHTATGIVTMNSDGKTIKEYRATAGNFFSVVRQIFQDIKNDQ